MLAFLKLLFYSAPDEYSYLGHHNNDALNEYYEWVFLFHSTDLLPSLNQFLFIFSLMRSSTPTTSSCKVFAAEELDGSDYKWNV